MQTHSLSLPSCVATQWQWLDRQPPWRAALVGAALGYSAVKVWQCYQNTSWEWCCSTSLHWIRNAPLLGRIIQKEIDKEKNKITQETLTELGRNPAIEYLPDEPMYADGVKALFDQRVANTEERAQEGKLSGTVYHREEHLLELQGWIAQRTLQGNPLHVDSHRAYVRMEAEVVAMVAKLFNGGTEAVGVMTEGGTLSILHACLAYRNWGLREKGLDYCEMVIPSSAHAAFDKAAVILGMRVRKVPVDPRTHRADVDRMKSAITANTVMLVGSTPSYPVGVVDDILSLSLIAKERGIPLHVDACLGSLVVPFAKIGPFDFSLPAVTSISVDTHKFGYAPKGSSTILYRDKRWRSYQMFKHTDWSGGVYVTPSIPGSRSGLAVATTWATLLYFGEAGFRHAAQKVLEARRQLESALRVEKGVRVLGQPVASVVGFDTPGLNIYDVVDGMKHRGWELNPLQEPRAVHFCLTLLHAMLPDFSLKFMEDLRLSMDEAKGRPKGSSSMAKMYGATQSVPSEFAGEVGVHFWDEMYRVSSVVTD